jgi:hypothetical protein
MAGGTWERRAAKLLEAQFYMSELDRREAEKERKESRRIATLDFRMELAVIALIALEPIVAIWGIVIGLRESKEQAAITQKQIEMLDRVEKAANKAANTNLIFH